MTKYTDGLEFLQESLDKKNEWKRNKEEHGSIRTNMGELALTSELYAYVGVEETIVVINDKGIKFEIKINVKGE